MRAGFYSGPYLFVLFATIGFLISSPLHAQQDQPGSYTYGWQLRGVASTAGDTPFWLHSNRYGAFDRYSANAALNLFGSWRHTFDSGISVATEADVLFRGADESVIRFQQAYAQAGYRGFLLSAGRRQKEFGMVHPELSMGTVDLSRNTRPIPKITFETDGFRHIPGTHRVASYDASLSHGWVDDTDYRYAKDVLLHQKHLYLRIFGDDAPVSPRAGIKHFAHWGAGFDHLGDDSPVQGNAPVTLSSYRDVFFSLASDSKEIIGGGELSNRHQNHFGSYDFALVVNRGRYRMAISRQFILEDTPNARFGTPWDGLWGAYIELRPDTETRWRDESNSTTPDEEHRPLLKTVHYEHINTLDGLTRYEHRDRERHVNYYNHSVYRGGWTYEGRSLGNPLFIGHPDYLGVINNQLVGHHVGLMGFAGPVDWRFMGTYSRNYGAGRVPDAETGRRMNLLTDRRDQWSFMLEVTTAALHPDLEAATTLAYDTGELYDDNFGIMVSLRWSPGNLQY